MNESLTPLFHGFRLISVCVQGHISVFSWKKQGSLRIKIKMKRTLVRSIKDLQEWDAKSSPDSWTLWRTVTLPGYSVSCWNTRLYFKFFPLFILGWLYPSDFSFHLALPHFGADSDPDWTLSLCFISASAFRTGTPSLVHCSYPQFLVQSRCLIIIYSELCKCPLSPLKFFFSVSILNSLEKKNLVLHPP